MSLLSTLLSKAVKAVIAAAKPVLNALFDTQKPKIKAFVHGKIDSFYSQFDNVTSVPTIAKLLDYLKAHVGESGFASDVVEKLNDLIAVGVATGMAEMGLKAADALTKAELDKIESYIDDKIDGARF